MIGSCEEGEHKGDPLLTATVLQLQGRSPPFAICLLEALDYMSKERELLTLFFTRLFHINYRY